MWPDGHLHSMGVFDICKAPEGWRTLPPWRDCREPQGVIYSARFWSAAAFRHFHDERSFERAVFTPAFLGAFGFGCSLIKIVCGFCFGSLI